MSDTAILYVFIFLMVSNLLLSVVYAIGTRDLKTTAARAFRKK